MTANSASRGLILACLAAVYLVWGTTYFALKVAVQGAGPYFLVGTRFVVAGVLLLGWLKLRGARMPTPRQWANSALLGFLMLAMCFIAPLFWAYGHKLRARSPFCQHLLKKKQEEEEAIREAEAQAAAEGTNDALSRVRSVGSMDPRG